MTSQHKISAYQPFRVVGGRCHIFFASSTQSVDKTQKHEHIALVQVLHAEKSFLHQLRMLGIAIEKLLRCDFQIIADGKELFHRRERFTRRDVVNISSALAKVIAHFVLGNALLDTQLRNAITDKFLVHDYHLVLMITVGDLTLV